MLVPMKLICVKRRALYYLREHSTLNSIEEMGLHLSTLLLHKICLNILKDLRPYRDDYRRHSWSART